MTDYFVDSQEGNDANTGLSETEAWQTIGHVNSHVFSPGDNVLLKANGLWQETLDIQQSGTAESKITFASYGVGAKPTLDGAPELTGWTQEQITSEDFTDGTGPRPEGWWWFENPLPMEDGSTNGNNLTAHGVTLTPDAKQGQHAVYCGPGQNEYMSIPAAGLSASFPLKAPTAALTIGGWIKPKSLPGFGYLYLHGDLNIATTGKKVRLSMKIAGTSDWENRYSGEVLGVDKWTFVVTRWNGAVQELLIDGQVVDSKNFTGIDHSDTAQLSMGGRGQADGADVIMDEWFAFNESLTDGQIGDIMNFGLRGGNVTLWKKATNEPSQVFEQQEYLQKADSKNLAEGQWYWDAPSGQVYVRCWDDDDPNNNLMEASTIVRMVTGAQSHIVIEDLALTRAHTYGINFNSAMENITVRGCNIVDNGGNGIFFGQVRNSLVENNVMQGNADSGIELIGGCEDVLIQHNSVLENNREHGRAFSGGIRLIADNDVHRIVIRYNEVWDTAVHVSQAHALATSKGEAIWLDTPGNGCECYGNKTYGNRLSGIFIEGSRDDPNGGVSCYGNSVWESEIGIRIRRQSHNNLVANNTVADCGIGYQCWGEPGGGDPTGMVNNRFLNNIYKRGPNYPDGVALFAKDGGDNDGVDGSGNVYEHNCFDTEATNFVTWGANFFSTYDAWEAVYGDSHSVKTDPGLYDPANQDFRLLPDSPCIAQGTNVDLMISQGFTPYATSPDLGAYSRLSEALLNLDEPFMNLIGKDKETKIEVHETKMTVEQILERLAEM